MGQNAMSSMKRPRGPDRMPRGRGQGVKEPMPFSFRAERGDFGSEPQPLLNPAGLRRLCLAGVAAALLGAAPARAGDIHPFPYHSAALGSDQVAQVYVPSEPAPAGGWPVLYLLHGLHGKPSDFATVGDLRGTLDRLIQSGQVMPLVVVMPDGGNSWYVDSAAVGGPGNYATAIGRDVQGAVEAAFPVGRDKLHRAIAGISMGGFGALRLALSDPDRYVAVAALSPAVWQNAEDLGPPYFQRLAPATVTIGVDGPDPKHFGTAFGTPFDPKRFDDANVFTLLQHDLDAKKALPAMFLTVGDDDSHLLWRGAIAFFETMQADGRPIDFRVTDGDHAWSVWKPSLADALLFIARNLGKVPVR